EVNFDSASFAHFVEPDFPYITTSMDGRNLGEGFPNDNISARVLAVKLGENAAMAFDTDMLRWSVAWTGGFLPMVTMAQISYNDFHNKDNLLPVIGGDAKIATGQYAGWSKGSLPLNDPRPAASHPDALPWGPLPEKVRRWNGVYVLDEGVVLSYALGNTEIYERPGALQADQEVACTRTFKRERQDGPLALAAAEVSNGIRHEIKGNIAYLFHGDESNSVTAVGIVGAREDIALVVKDNRYLTVELAPGADGATFTLALWKGSVNRTAAFEQLLKEAKVDFPDYHKGSSSRWKEKVLTKGKVSPDTAAYVVDDLTLPIPNPWNRNVRLVDISFFDGDKAAGVTFEGDVWIIEGINNSLNKLVWKRFASGLYEPQS